MEQEDTSGRAGSQREVLPRCAGAWSGMVTEQRHPPASLGIPQ